METRQGKIEEKSLKFAANKAAYATFVIDGMKYNSFDKEIVDNHNPDDFVEFTGEQVGAYWQLKTMRKMGPEETITTGPAIGKTPMVKTNGKEYHLSPEEVKCRALEAAQRFLGETDEFNKLITIADKFVEWIYGK